MWNQSLGAENVETPDPTMGGGFFRIQAAGSFDSGGRFSGRRSRHEKIAALEERGAQSLPLLSLHSSRFAPVPEPIIRTGVAAMTGAVFDLMKN